MNGSYDFGPSPYRFFNLWLSLEGLDYIVSKAWHDSVFSGTSDSRLSKKLKAIKNNIKTWRLERKHKQNADYKEL